MLDYESRGQGFESLRARQKNPRIHKEYEVFVALVAVVFLSFPPIMMLTFLNLYFFRIGH